MSNHEILIGIHWHGEEAAGLEVACDCGAILLEECCGPESLLQLSELNSLARDHEHG